jgi:hypothetical protein
MRSGPGLKTEGNISIDQQHTLQPARIQKSGYMPADPNFSPFAPVLVLASAAPIIHDVRERIRDLVLAITKLNLRVGRQVSPCGF